MKLLSSLRRLLAVLLLLAVLPACSTVESRIKSNPELYAGLKPTDQLLVQQGRVRNGMAPGAVFLAWGSPDEVAQGQSGKQVSETWRYYSTEYNSYPVVVDDYCYTRRGRFRVVPRVDYITTSHDSLWRTARFLDDRLTEWEDSSSRRWNGW